MSSTRRRRSSYKNVREWPNVRTLLFACLEHFRTVGKLTREEYGGEFEHLQDIVSHGSIPIVGSSQLLADDDLPF